MEDFKMPSFLGDFLSKKSEPAKANELAKVIELARECGVEDLSNLFEKMVEKLYPEPLKTNEIVDNVVGIISKVVNAGGADDEQTDV